MAGISCTTGAISYGTVSQGGHTQVITLTGNFYGLDEGFTNYAYWTFGVTHTDTAPYNIITGLNGYTFGDGGSGYQTYEVNGVLQGNWGHTPALRVLPCDTTHVRRAKITDDGGGSAQGTSISFKTYAITAVAGTPGSSSVTATTATINCDYYPNTVESTATIWLEYKKSADSTWITAGSTTAQTGYSILNLSRNLTGLTGSTQYQFRLQMTRTTENETTLTSATSTFTTLANDPTITTVAAGVVTSTTAVLNSTLAINNQSSVNVKWVYGTSNPPVAGVGDGLEVSYASNPATASGSYGVNIASLTASTTYYFFAKVYWNAGASSASGSVLSFATSADPAAEAANEDHMQIFEFDRKYATATTIYFTVASPAATSSDRWFNAATPFVAGDIQISIDGAPFGNIGTLPTRIGTTALFSMPLTGPETTGTIILIQIVDQNGPTFRDALIIVRTKQHIGQIDVDASGIGSSASAFVLTPSTGGYGVSATADPKLCGAIRTGATQAGSAGGTIVLDASASTSDDFYNGNIVVVTAGTGVGQARIITDYVQSTQTCSVHKTWVTTPGTGVSFLILPGNDLWEVSPLVELAALPTAASSFGKLVQFLFQRFAYKRTQTATTHTMMKADSSTPIATAGVADSAGTQSFNKLA